MEKLSPWRTGIAVALTTAIVNIVCAAAVYLFPDGTLAFVNSWTHGIDLAALQSEKPWTVGGFVLGLFNVSLTGFLVGALFAACSNLTTTRPKRT
jgi:hypothetical protein